MKNKIYEIFSFFKRNKLIFFTTLGFWIIFWSIRNGNINEEREENVKLQKKIERKDTELISKIQNLERFKVDKSTLKRDLEKKGLKDSKQEPEKITFEIQY